MIFCIWDVVLIDGQPTNGVSCEVYVLLDDRILPTSEGCLAEVAEGLDSIEMSVPEGHIGEVRAIGVVAKDLHPFPVARVDPEVLLLQPHFIYKVSRELAIRLGGEVVESATWPWVQLNVKPYPTILRPSLCEVAHQLSDLRPRIHGPTGKQVCVHELKAGSISIPQAFYGVHIHGPVLLPRADDEELETCAL